MKAEGEQGIKIGLVGGMGLSQTNRNGRFEGGKVGIVMGIETLFADKLPQALNAVEIRGISRQETQFDAQMGSGFANERTTLISGIIQEQANRYRER